MSAKSKHNQNLVEVENMMPREVYHLVDNHLNLQSWEHVLWASEGFHKATWPSMEQHTASWCFQQQYAPIRQENIVIIKNHQIINPTFFFISNLQ
jgi:hypothetical protein